MRVQSQSGLIAIVVWLAVALLADAHPDHEHRIYGTVVSITSSQIEIRDGADLIPIALNGDTKFARGRQRITLAEIKIDERVAVDVTSEFPPFTAKEVVVQEPKKAKKPKR
jgi:hypothetical protein